MSDSPMNNAEKLRQLEAICDRLTAKYKSFECDAERLVEAYENLIGEEVGNWSAEAFPDVLVAWRFADMLLASSVTLEKSLRQFPDLISKMENDGKLVLQFDAVRCAHA